MSRKFHETRKSPRMDDHEMVTIFHKPPRNSARFCGGGQGLSWAVEPRKERKEEEE
jgi:hypothetical protein